MKNLIYQKSFILVLILGLILPLWGHSLEIMPLDQVKKGMKGKAVTVFSGMQKEEFDVEILSIVYNSGPKQAMILAKFTGSNVERSGIAQGMSGSPVYINGKVIGAIAYTWPNLKESIGGIQPIEQMLPVLEKPLVYPKVRSREGFTLREHLDPSKDIVPIKLPLVISGFDSQAYQIATQGMDQIGIHTIQGAGAGGKIPSQTKKKAVNKKNVNTKRSKNKSQALKAGDAVGILLMRGDAAATAVGTVTYVNPKDPSEILLFGHPFQELGYMKFPMTNAIVHHIMPSSEIAWKFASAQDIVGTVYNDRKTAVAGKLGEFTPMIPVSVTVKDTEQKKTDQFNYEIVQNGDFFPSLFAGAVVNSFSRFGAQIFQTLKMQVQINVKNTTTNQVQKISLNHYLAGKGETINQAIGAIVKNPLDALFMNFYSEIEIQSVHAEIESVSQLQVARISQVIVGDSHTKPGQNAKVRVVLNTFQNKKEMVTLEIPIPTDYKEPFIPVTIAGGVLAENNLDTLYAGLKDPQNFDQLMEYLKSQPIEKDLVAYYDTQGISANVDGYILKDLPLSKAYDFGVKQQTNKYFRAVRHSFNFPSNYLVIGQFQVMIPVKNS